MTMYKYYFGQGRTLRSTKVSVMLGGQLLQSSMNRLYQGCFL